MEEWYNRDVFTKVHQVTNSWEFARLDAKSHENISHLQENLVRNNALLFFSRRIINHSITSANTRMIKATFFDDAIPFIAF